MDLGKLTGNVGSRIKYFEAVGKLECMVKDVLISNSQAAILALRPCERKLKILWNCQQKFKGD